VSLWIAERSYCETKLGALRATSLYFVIGRGIHSRMLEAAIPDGFGGLMRADCLSVHPVWDRFHDEQARR